MWVIADLRRPATAGKNPSAVRAVEILTSEALEAQVFHLKTTLEAHQKLDTLSSKSPRANGNILVTGCRMVDSDAKGGSHGKNNNRKVDAVTRVRRTKSCPLKLCQNEIGKQRVEKITPSWAPSIDI